MISRAVGITAVCCAVVSHALLIPSTTSRDLDLVNPLVDPKSRSIQLPCPSCSNLADVEEYHDDYQTRSQSRINEVNLSFDVTNDGRRLQLNGAPIYPQEFHREAYMRGASYYVNQVSPSGGITPVEVTSSGLKVLSERPVPGSGEAVVLLKFQVMALDMHPMDRPLEVVIDLLRMGNGELFIVTVENTPNLELPVQTPSLQTSSEDNSCGVLPLRICQAKNSLLDRLEAIRFGNFVPPSSSCSHHHDSHGHSTIQIRPHPEHHSESLDYYGRPVSSRPYFHHHHHHKPHYLHTFARGIIAVLIPILAGITVGLFVSFLGLFVGRLVGYLWIKFVRGGDRRGHRRCYSHDTEYDDGKISIDGGRIDPLPPYEDAPAYEEIEGESR